MIIFIFSIQKYLSLSYHDQSTCYNLFQHYSTSSLFFFTNHHYTRANCMYCSWNSYIIKDNCIVLAITLNPNHLHTHIFFSFFLFLFCLFCFTQLQLNVFFFLRFTLFVIHLGIQYSKSTHLILIGIYWFLETSSITFADMYLKYLVMCISL